MSLLVDAVEVQMTVWTCVDQTDHAPGACFPGVLIRAKTYDKTTGLFAAGVF